MAKFVERDQSQLYLLPVDMRDWVPEDDLTHFVLEAVNRVPMSTFVVNERGTGSAQYHPRMMLALLVYCYANGIFGSRRIERATYRDLGVRYVASNCHPDHDTICAFRRNNFEAVAKAFEQVLLMAKELKLLRVGTVSVDGTKVDANANKRNNVRHDRAKELPGEIETLLARAEHEDSEDATDPQALPQELSRQERLREQLDRACAELERRARSAAAKGACFVRAQGVGAGASLGAPQGGAHQGAKGRAGQQAAHQPDGCGQRADAQEQAARVPSGIQRPGGGGCRRQPVGVGRAGDHERE